MKIKDLKGKHPRIYGLAMLRQKEAGNEANEYRLDRDGNGGGFTWEETKEGLDFWRSIYDGEYDIFYQKYPEPNRITEIKKGDRFRCVKDVVMNDNPIDVAFTKGFTYVSDNDRCITNDKGNINHFCDVSQWQWANLYFTKLDPDTQQDLTYEQVANNWKDKFNQGIPELTKPDYYRFAINETKCDLFDIADAMGLSIRLFSALKYFRVKGDKLKQINDLQKAKECIDLEIESLRKEC